MSICSCIRHGNPFEFRAEDQHIYVICAGFPVL
jgi:hypothetical protein